MAEVPEALGLAPEQVHQVLEAASLAPSVHNAQPWRFEYVAGALIRSSRGAGS